MAKTPRKQVTINPADVNSEIVDKFSFTVMSRDFDDRQKTAIAAATDPLAKATLASRRIMMHIENARTAITFLEARGGLSKSGILCQPAEQLQSLTGIKAEIEQAISFFKGIDWPRT